LPRRNTAVGNKTKKKKGGVRSQTGEGKLKVLCFLKGKGAKQFWGREIGRESAREGRPPFL